MKVDIEVLKAISSIPSGFGNVSMEVKKGKLSLRNYSATKREQLYMNADLIESNKDEEGKVMVINPETLAVFIKKFGAAKEIELKVSESVLTLGDGIGNEITYYMLDPAEANPIPKEKEVKIEDGRLLVAKEIVNGKPLREPVSTIVTGTTTDIKPAFTDMSIAEVDYYTLTFSEAGSNSESGHWDSKSTKSKSKIRVNVEGEKIEFTGDDFVKQIFEKQINGDFVMEIGEGINGIVVARIIDNEHDGYELFWVLMSISKK